MSGLYQYRIGDVYFETYDDADDWVKAGNIGGTYSIVRQVYCVDSHLGFFDEVYDLESDELVCVKCFRIRQEDRYRQRQADQEAARQHNQELAELAAWNTGQPIRANEGCGR